MRETSIHVEYPAAHVADWICQSKANLHYQQALRDAVSDALDAAGGRRRPLDRLPGWKTTTH